MKKPKILYVNDIYPDKTKGFAKTRNNIVYNLKNINQQGNESFTEILIEHKESTIVLPAGRYICIGTIGLTDKLEGMLIMDLQNDPKKLAKTLEGFAEPRLSEKVKDAFEIIKNSPSKYYDFEMEIGEAPSTE